MKFLDAVTITIALTIATSAVMAQGIGEPDYIGVVIAVDGSKGSATQLERQTPKYKSEGILNAVTARYFELSAAKSPVRLVSPNQQFVARVESQDLDPTVVIQFFVLDVKDGNRLLPHLKYNFVGKADDSLFREHQIPFTAKKFGAKSFLIEPAQPLKPGEYMLSTKGSDDGFAFGIDAR